jgi:hypothetical protein
MLPVRSQNSTLLQATTQYLSCFLWYSVITVE